ncbi:MAG TPA: hypothetical protein VMO20_05665, partial [Candidatus Acidoferrum sp.]|nr:hypothetical protein [Candidatus Acidoferrum sp.]
MGDRTSFWKKCRFCFRLFRIAVLLIILAIVCAVIGLNRIGLPDFVKRPLIEALHQRGIELQFVRMRWDPYRGLVADNVHIGGATTNAPSATFSQVRLELNYSALLRRKFQLDGLVLRQGTITFPVPETNGPPCVLTLDHLQTDLHFGTNDVWSLDNFQASFAGAKFILSGQLAHASAAQHWKIFQQKPAAAGTGQAQFGKIARTLNEIHFNGLSQLNLNVSGDAGNLDRFSVHLVVSAPAANTPWGSAKDLELIGYTPAPSKTAGVPDSPPELRWTAHVSQLEMENLDADSIYCGGLWRAPMELQWNAEVSRLVSPKLNADFISCGGFWHDPELALTNLYVRLGGGDLRAAAQFNMSTRQFSFTNSSCFDLNAVTVLLTEKTRERLAQFSLPRAPELRANGSFILPDWTKHALDWRNDIQPTIQLNGELAVTNAGFSGLFFDKVHTYFSYSNEVWTVPDAVITHQEGQLAVTGTENDATRDYQWHIFGWFPSSFIEPFLNPKAMRGIHNFAFSQPLHLDAQVRGRLYDYDSIDAAGHAALKKFSIRGESIDSVETDFHYAHRVAEFFQPHLEAGQQTMKADGILLDYPGDRVYFTNGFGTADPQMVAAAIGPLQAQIMRPYYFPQLPTARVNGYAPLRDGTNADLDFQIVGSTPLQILKVKTPHITGEIHWKGQTLLLTNLSGAFYDGDGTGWALFVFSPGKGANFSFDTSLRDVNLHLLATDLGSPTNHLEGLVSGHFVVTSGNSTDWRSCYGHGNISMRDGLLWDVPVFGILSPLLNMVSPGLGNSRATDASAQFVMKKGVISTDNLQIHTAMMSLL